MRLIEQRQRIAHRAFRRARDQRQRRRLDLDLFLGGDALEMLDQQRGIDAAQIEALAARQHRHRHLADFGGGEDELGVRRRLFQRLEQRVERRAREHVHFVEDVDLVARRHRRVADGVVDLAHVLDALCEAASISSTSRWRLSMIAWQCTPIAGMVMVGAVTEPSGNS